jgi:hypothetical protein
MNKRLPYEEQMAEQLKQVSLPDENMAWADMKRRLEGDMIGSSTLVTRLFAWGVSDSFISLDGGSFVQWFEKKKERGT